MTAPEAPPSTLLGQSEAAGEDALPDVFQGIVDERQLLDWHRDITSATRVREVRLKGHATRRVGPGGESLSDAWSHFRAGRAIGLQVYYDWKDESWCDTLLRAGNSVRLVRMRTPAARDS